MKVQIHLGFLRRTSIFRLIGLTHAQGTILAFLHRIDHSEWLTHANFFIGSRGGPHNDHLVASVETAVSIEGGSQWPTLIIERTSITTR